jgi:hypothetical protein
VREGVSGRFRSFITSQGDVRFGLYNKRSLTGDNSLAKQIIIYWMYELLTMEQGIRYMNTILVFLSVGLLLFTAYPMIIGNGLYIAILIFVLAGLVALSAFIYTGEFNR